MNKFINCLLPFVLFGCVQTTNNQQVIEVEVEPTPAVPEQVELVDEREPQLNLFLEQTPAKVLSWLPSPTLVRRDGDVQIFQFASGVCVFDVYFYRVSLQSDFYGEHVDARSLNGQDMANQTCLLSFFSEKPYPEELLSPLVDDTGEDG